MKSVPQKRLRKLLNKYEIQFIDLLPIFREKDNSRHLFLSTDPMHLSEKGHELAASEIQKTM